MPVDHAVGGKIATRVAVSTVSWGKTVSIVIAAPDAGSLEAFVAVGAVFACDTGIWVWGCCSTREEDVGSVDEVEGLCFIEVGWGGGCSCEQGDEEDAGDCAKGLMGIHVVLRGELLKNA